MSATQIHIFSLQTIDIYWSHTATIQMILSIAPRDFSEILAFSLFLFSFHLLKKRRQLNKLGFLHLKSLQIIYCINVSSILLFCKHFPQSMKKRRYKLYFHCQFKCVFIFILLLPFVCYWSFFNRAFNTKELSNHVEFICRESKINKTQGGKANKQ